MDIREHLNNSRAQSQLQHEPFSRNMDQMDRRGPPFQEAEFLGPNFQPQQAQQREYGGMPAGRDPFVPPNTPQAPMFRPSGMNPASRSTGMDAPPPQSEGAFYGDRFRQQSPSAEPYRGEAGYRGGPPAPLHLQVSDAFFSIHFKGETIGDGKFAFLTYQFEVWNRPDWSAKFPNDAEFNSRQKFGLECKLFSIEYWHLFYFLFGKSPGKNRIQSLRLATAVDWLIGCRVNRC